MYVGGDICKCYDDDNNGYWVGVGCGNCMKGWNFLICIECDLGMFDLNIVIIMIDKVKY